MKKINKSTWIALGCVALAVLASRLYMTVDRGEIPQKEVSLQTEVRITPTPSPESSVLTASPAPTQKPAEATPPSAPVHAPVLAQASPSPVPEEQAFQLPSSGEAVKPYSDKELVYFEPLKEWRCHLGIDFAPSENDSVLATTGGTVSRVYEDHLYGKTIVLDHGNGLESLYASLSEVLVEEGGAVSGGQEIGKMGETAPGETGVHLHFAMKKDGKIIDPFGAK